ncbi:MAG TPA: hypothetical protein VFB32_03430, partial [Rudaea sp.]|nr:hypothetical protein [Rudaea sp.]
YEQPVNNYFASVFYGVTVLSPKDAWAVGYEEASEQSQVPQTLIEHWNGSAWSVVPSPDENPKGPYKLNNTLYSVVSRSATDVWAVGFWTSPDAGPLRALFLHWNGKAWHIAAGPPALESKESRQDSSLLGITKLPSSELWAVGNQSIPSVCCSRTLTVQAKKSP